MRFKDIYGEYLRGALSSEDASKILGMSVRTFLRKRIRYAEEGEEMCFDRRIGKPSHNRAADVEVEHLTKLYEEKYRGFTVKHFYDFVCWEYPDTKLRSYNWFRLTLQGQGLVEKSGRGGPHRLRRERKAMTGMMLHQDGSTHRWIPFLNYDVDLIVTMDDATSEITSAFFASQEGVRSSFQGIKETIKKYGIFCSLYTDRGSHYAYTPEAGGKADKRRLTQVGRALKQLGIQHIYAYSPQARGRSERMFGTLQDRLPKELVLQGAKTLDQANQYLRDSYLPRHNALFSHKAQEARTAYTPWLHYQSLDEILCIQEERQVQRDNTIRYGKLILQIPQQEHRNHYVRATVEIRKYDDETLAIFYGHHCLARYDQNGNLLAQQKQGQLA